MVKYGAVVIEGDRKNPKIISEPAEGSLDNYKFKEIKLLTLQSTTLQTQLQVSL